MNDRYLMEIRADTDFTYDARGRMLETNEPREVERRPAPRLFLGCTVAGNVVRLGASVPDALARQLQETMERELPAGALRPPPTALAAVRKALLHHGPSTAEATGPVYRFPPSIARPGQAVPLRHANRDLTRSTYPWLFEEIADWQPCFAIVRDGAAVSVCYSSRSGPAAAEAGVDTVPQFRGRGYAAAVTAAWGAAILESGRIPLYSTPWDNQASRGVARRVGLEMFGTDATWS